MQKTDFHTLMLHHYLVMLRFICYRFGYIDKIGTIEFIASKIKQEYNLLRSFIGCLIGNGN